MAGVCVGVSWLVGGVVGFTEFATGHSCWPGQRRRAIRRQVRCVGNGWLVSEVCWLVGWVVTHIDGRCGVVRGLVGC